MGLRVAAILSATSFLLGVLFTHWTADSLTLWKPPPTDAHLWTAARYYHILLRAPSVLAYGAIAAAVLGAAAILGSLRDGAAGNIMFDGGSIFLFGTAVFMYASSVVPLMLDNFAVLPLELPNGTFPPSLHAPTLSIASSHLVCSVALTGVLALQAGRWWSERADDDDEERPPSATAAAAADDKSASAPDTATAGRKEKIA